MTDLELHEERQIARADDSRYFDLVLKQANVLASADIVPVAYRGKAADIVAAGLAGRAFGWDVMASMRNFHVIEGSASLRPEAMLGLVRQAGHSVTIDVSDGVAIAVGKRADTGDEHKASFTLDDAQAAGLANKRNWKQYQESMLTWRAVSKLCRNLFSDVVLGAGYVPEEVGAEVDVEGMPLEAAGGADVLVNSKTAKQRLLDELDGDKEAAKAVWGQRGSTSIRTSQLAALIEIALADKPLEAEMVPTDLAATETV